MLLGRRLLVLLLVVGLRLGRGAGWLRASLQLLQGGLARMLYVLCFLGIQRARGHRLVPVLILLVYWRPGRELQSIVGMVGQGRRRSYRPALVSNTVTGSPLQPATSKMQRVAGSGVVAPGAAMRNRKMVRNSAEV